MSDTYRVPKFKHALISASIGVVLTGGLMLLNNLAARSNNAGLMNATYAILFWTAGLLGSFFDWLMGTKSYWMPNGFGYLAALLFDVIVFSLFGCVVLWLVQQFRHAAD